MEEFDEFAMLTQLTRQKLIHVLESVVGSKELVVEQSLMRPLDKVANMSLLQRHNCRRVQQLYLDRAMMFDPDIENRVFLVRPQLATVRKICEFVKAEPSDKYSVVFVDRKLNICELEFEKQGVFGMVECYELNLSFIPIESDLFSLELPSASGDYQSMAKCLWQLQSLYGSIPNQLVVGRAAADCQKVLKRINMENGEPAASANQPISHLFIFDRQVDLVSVLLTGLTYESMLNDHFAYSCGKIVFGDAVEGKLKQKSSAKKVIPLNNTDMIFSAVRNRHMTQVFPFLSAKAKTLQQSFDKASAMNKVEEVKDFVSNELRQLKQNHKMLELHICACEVLLDSSKGSADRFPIEHAIVKRQVDPNVVMEYLELSMCRQQNPWSILQLACLWSVCDGGIPTKYYETFRVAFLHACGYEYLTVLYYLQLNGLLTEKTTSLSSNFNRSGSFKDPSVSPTRKGSFAQLAKTLNLTTDADVMFDAKSASKPSYVFSDAYTPLVVQIVSQTAADGWPQTKLQKALGNDVPIAAYPVMPAKPDNRIRKAIVVAMIGGITFAEVAALRQFAQNHNFRLIMVATHIVNREEFLKTFVPV